MATLDDQFRELIKRLFDALDVDGDGEIDWVEFVDFQLFSHGSMEHHWTLDYQQVRNEFKELDLDGNGKISEEEFIKVMSRNVNNGVTLEAVTALRAVVQKIAQANAAVEAEADWRSMPLLKRDFIRLMMERFDQADRDKSGEITFSEYVRHEWSESQNHRKVTMKQMRDEFNKMDTDGNGEISRLEFRMLAERIYEASVGQERDEQVEKGQAH